MEYILVGLVVISTLLIVGLGLAQAGEPPPVGREAPAFDLPGTDGARHSPAAWRGRRAVVFFFPMDDTPECLAVVAKFKEAAPRIEAAGARLVAVAVASQDATRAYAEAQGIPFPVLADEGGRAAKAWGTLVNFVFYKFAKKLTVVLDAGGRVERRWRDSAATGHVDEVVATIESGVR